MNDKTATNSDIDMNTYHQEGIDPGDHKVFSISPEIHSFSDKTAQDLEWTSNVPMRTESLDPSLQANIEDRRDAAPMGSFEAFARQLWSQVRSHQQLKDFTKGEELWHPADSQLKKDIGYEDIGQNLQPEDKSLGEKFLEKFNPAYKISDDDIKRIKMMPGLLTGPTSKGAKQFMSQEEAMARLDKGLRGLMRENWKPGPGSYKTREKSDIDTSVQIKPGKDTVKPSLPQLNILKKRPEELSSEEVKFLSDWYKNQFEGGPTESPETVKAAALKHSDTGKVYEGSAHFMALENAAKDYPGHEVYSQPWEEGFTTSTGRFVDRREAGNIALQADQLKPEWESHYTTLKKATGKDTALITEDLKNMDSRYTPKPPGVPKIKFPSDDQDD